MTLFEGAALGLLQGLTEFLPVSSSGHLALAKRLFGLSELPLLFDVSLHLATLAAVLVAFRERICGLAAALGRWLARRSTPEDGGELQFILAILVGTALTGAIGLGLERLGLGENPKLVSAGFLATALLLVLSERIGSGPGRKGGSPGPREGILVGIAQGIGVLPGVSRSGITISASLAAGVDRGKAGEFSFILSIPAVLGAFLLELKDAGEMMAGLSPAPLALGLLLAFASGLAAIKLFLGLVRRSRLSWFAAYLAPLGIAGLIWL
ncbi:MAG TPA: undecaprenyl-diphosphate phosphatase [Spirochaetales bacterium]|nr:undecaprenyl-diphosphate phosphatase [Spirochaetales bacterium]HRY56441.1 undecaprenyl-diphosphate phosphatase [Spirochaetia bacterium]HRZ64744.1 undecaprenyl-diphosphate phosphatase [Spirochaetia bacterium]